MVRSVHFHLLFLALVVAMFTAKNSFAEPFNVFGNSNSDTNLCNCTGIIGCNCYQDNDVRARCSFPSNRVLSKLLEQQLKRYYVVDLRCSNVKVAVNVRSANSGKVSVNGAGRVGFSTDASNPFRVRVTELDADCTLEVPVTVTVRAKDSFGNSIRQRYNSSPSVRGVLR